MGSGEEGAGTPPRVHERDPSTSPSSSTPSSSLCRSPDRGHALRSHVLSLALPCANTCAQRTTQTYTPCSDSWTLGCLPACSARFLGHTRGALLHLLRGPQGHGPSHTRISFCPRARFPLFFFSSCVHAPRLRVCVRDRQLQVLDFVYFLLSVRAQVPVPTSCTSPKKSRDMSLALSHDEKILWAGFSIFVSHTDPHVRSRLPAPPRERIGWFLSARNHPGYTERSSAGLFPAA